MSNPFHALISSFFCNIGCSENPLASPVSHIYLFFLVFYSLVHLLPLMVGQKYDIKLENEPGKEMKLCENKTVVKIVKSGRKNHQKEKEIVNK